MDKVTEKIFDEAYAQGFRHAIALAETAVKYDKDVLATLQTYYDETVKVEA